MPEEKEKEPSIMERLKETKEKMEKETSKKKRGNPKLPELSRKYWGDVKTGKKELWSKRKVYDKTTKKWIMKEELKPEIKKESKSEIKLDKKPPDKEAEEIKEELEEKVSDAEILKKKEETIIVEPKEIKEELEKVDSTWLIYGLVGLVAIFILMQVFKKSSPPMPAPVPETPEQDYYEVPRADGSVIKIPKVRR